MWMLSFLIIAGCKGPEKGADKAPAPGAGAAPAAKVADGSGPVGSAGSAGSAAAGEPKRQGAGVPVVRISKGAFPPEKYEEVRARLDAAKETLVPAIRGLHGCLHYWAAIDQTSSTMINVSLWETLADARQMETLQPMQALAGEFIGIGVTFERPITNSQMVWEVPLGAQ